MRITKSRLLQIIREEVELHEKNTFIFEEAELEAASAEKDADKDGDGELSKKEREAAIKDEIEADEDAGNLEEIDVGEEKLFYKDKKVKDPQSGKMVHPVIEPKTPKSKSVLSVKLR